MQKKIFLILILGTILITTCSGMIADNITISTDKTWLVAGSSDYATITVKVMNGTNVMNSTPVQFILEDEMMGILSPNATVTDNNGIAKISIYPKKKSGDATIDITIKNSQPDNGVVLRKFIQSIDHAGPKYFLSPEYPSSSPVNTDTNIVVRFRDMYGNYLDDRNTAESFVVKFDASGSDGYFNGRVKSVTLPTKVNLSTRVEEATVTYHVPNLAGNNYFIISALNTSDVLPSSLYSVIEGVGSTPHHIDVTIGDNDINTLISNQTYADPKHYFILTYTIRDPYGNPVPERTLQWNTSAMEDATFKANYAGMVYLEYSKDYPQIVSVNASVPGTSVYKIDYLEFLQPPAIDFDLTANPQLMPSRDTPGKMYESAVISVKVIDYLGQPKAGEPITFSLDYATLHNESTYLTMLPVLNDPSTNNNVTQITIPTNSNGIANVRFFPGAFPTDRKDPLFNITATGTVLVTAQWDDKVPKSIQMTYKNYPFLKAVTSIDTDVCVVNQDINYTLTLIGDGYAISNPVDVVLLWERAGSMLKQIDPNDPSHPDRMVDAQKAADAFLSKMTADSDRVAVASYGDMVTNADITLSGGGNWGSQRDDINDDNTKNDWDPFVTDNYKGNGWINYTDYADIDLPFTGDLTAVKNTIDDYVPINYYFDRKDRTGNDQNNAAGLRYGLYKSITYLRNNKDSTRPRVVVGLIDSNYNWYGDPTANGNEMKSQFTGNSPQGGYYPLPDPVSNNFDAPNWNYDGDSELRNFQNMSVYAKDDDIILYMVVYSQGGISTFKQLQTLCNSTGGEAFYAQTPEDLSNRFRYIAEKIHQLASVNTVANIDFTKINVSYSDLGISQRDGEEVFNYTHREGLSTHLEKKNDTLIYYQYTQDDTSNWTTNHTFSWVVGNMSIKDIWTVKFIMNAKLPGNILMFGPQSNILVDNPDDELPPQQIRLPDAWISCYENWTVPITPQQIVDVFNASGDNNSTEGILNVSWDLSYTGNKTVKQVLFYQFSQFDNSWTNDWIRFDQLSNNASIATINGSYHSLLDLNHKQGFIKIQIFAFEDIPGGAFDREEYIPQPVFLCDSCIRVE